MSQVLRDDLLTGLSVLVAGSGTAPESLLGAHLVRFAPKLDEAGEGGAEWVSAQDAFDALVFDAGQLDSGIDGVRAVLDAAWIACAAVANGAFIPGGRGGRIVLIAPAGDAGPFAAAAVAGLENLARTLSVEWARYGITTTAVAPAQDTSADDLADVLAFLLSPAGAYFSGTRLDLDALRR